MLCRLQFSSQRPFGTPTKSSLAAHMTILRDGAHLERRRRRVHPGSPFTCRGEFYWFWNLKRINGVNALMALVSGASAEMIETVRMIRATDT